MARRSRVRSCLLLSRYYLIDLIPYDVRHRIVMSLLKMYQMQHFGRLFADIRVYSPLPPTLH